MAHLPPVRRFNRIALTCLHRFHAQHYDALTSSDNSAEQTPGTFLDNCPVREALPFLALPLPFCPRLMHLRVVLP